MVVKLSYEVNQNHNVFLFDPHNTNAPKYKSMGITITWFWYSMQCLFFTKKNFCFTFAKLTLDYFVLCCKIARILHLTTQEQWCNLKLIFLTKSKSFKCNYHINIFQPSPAFHIETYHLICTASKSNDWFLYEIQHWAKID